MSDLLYIIPLATLIPMLILSCIYIFILFAHPKDKYPLKIFPIFSIFLAHLLPLLLTITL